MQHFLARFNKVYHSIPTKIKPPPGWALLHYPDTFYLEMEFQIRERDPSSLEEMKRMVVDVETNMLNRESKLRAMEKDKVDQEKLISLEIKIEILIDTNNKMMHMFDRKEEEYEVEVGADYLKQSVLFFLGRKNSVITMQK